MEDMLTGEFGSLKPYFFFAFFLASEGNLHLYWKHIML